MPSKLVALTNIKTGSTTIEAGATVHEKDFDRDALEGLLAAGAVGAPPADVASVDDDTEDQIASLKAQVRERDETIAQLRNALANKSSIVVEESVKASKK
jgi:hypothetical protein